MAPGHCGAIFSAVRRCRWLSSRIRCISRFSLARSSLLVSSLYCAVNSCNFPPSLPVHFQLVRFLFFSLFRLSGADSCWIHIIIFAGPLAYGLYFDNSHHGFSHRCCFGPLLRGVGFFNPGASYRVVLM